MPLQPPSLTLGIEEEYLLVDPDSRDLVATPHASFMAMCEQRLGRRVAHELLQAQVEVGTDVCRDIAELADFGAAACRPFGELLDELVGLLAAEADRLGCRAEVDAARTIVTRGTSADRQLAVYAKVRATGCDERTAQQAVVDWLIAETMAGVA